MLRKPDCFNKFRLHLIKNGRKDSTAKRHYWNIRRLLQDVKPLNKNKLDIFFLSLSDKGLKNTYFNSLVDTIRVFAQFKNLSDDLQKYPFFKETASVKATLSDEEIEAFLALPPIKNQCRETFEFWTLFFSIMAYTGMRPGEVAKLIVNDVDFGRQVFIVRETKTNDYRYVPIPFHLVSLLKKHIENYNSLLVFPKKTKEKPVGNSDWFYHFQKKIQRLGIKRTNLTCYSLRHSFITRMLETEDVNIFKVQKIVGHRQLETTAHYTHLTTKDIIKAIKNDPLIRKHANPEEILKRLKETIEAFRLNGDHRFEYQITETKKSLRVFISLRKP